MLHEVLIFVSSGRFTIRKHMDWDTFPISYAQKTCLQIIPIDCLQRQLLAD